MSYTPAFQKLLDQCNEMHIGGSHPEDISQHFFEGCQKLGQYERLNNLYRIRPKRPILGQTSRFQFFLMNKLQDTFMQNRTNRDLILKMRQGGVTTLSCLIALDMALFNYNVHTAIMAHVRDNVKKFFRVIKQAYSQFERDWGHLYPTMKELDNANELKLQPTGSELVVCTETKGLTLDFLHISEACFVEDDRISESVESVPMSGWVIMESTPNTASGLFYDIWMENENGKQGAYKNHFFPWWFQYPEEKDLEYFDLSNRLALTDEEKMLCKDYELEDKHILWRRMKISESGNDRAEFLRKYPEDPMTCFLSGSQSVFPAKILQNLFRKSVDPSFTGDLILNN